MTDQFDVLALVTSRLDAAKIAYMVTGSMASGYYGQPRMTRDVDLVVELGIDDPERLVGLLGDVFLVHADSVRAALAHGTMFNVIHQDAFVKVDFVIRKSEPYRIEEFGRRRRVELDGHAMWMVSAEDLVLSKLAWAQRSMSEVQMRDVRAIVTVQAARLDWHYMEQWATSLGVVEALRQVRS
jgi:hypothetical protein